MNEKKKLISLTLPELWLEKIDKMRRPDQERQDVIRDILAEKLEEERE